MSDVEQRAMRERVPTDDLLYGCAEGSHDEGSHDFDGEHCTECGLDVADYGTALEVQLRLRDEEIARLTRDRDEWENACHATDVERDKQMQRADAAEARAGALSQWALVMTGFLKLMSSFPQPDISTHRMTITGRERLARLGQQLQYGIQQQEDIMLGADENGLSHITVKKDELLAAITRNLEEHVAEYKLALAGYQNAFLVEAHDILHRAKNGDFSKTAITLPVPVSHEAEYRTVIRMLKMSTATEIRISDDQFRMYVEDEWNWKGAFVGTANRYKR